VALIVWGCTHDYGKELKPGLSRRAERMTRFLGAAGNATRGLWVLLLAWYLLRAVVSDDATHVKGVDQALLALERLSAGPLIVALGATGLAALAAFSFVEAKYRRL
jgi:hypothetical protein